MKKVTILTPTYNDSKSIIKTLESVISQTYDNWEQIIIDDGSTDDTKTIINDFKKKYDTNNKIKYVYEKNGDQLNALINGMQYINGDYVYTLHSDDLLPSNGFLEKAVYYLESHPTLDAIIGDLIIINEEDNITNKWKALKYRQKNFIPALVLLNYGANIYGDVSLQTVNNFKKNVYNNYLLWNTPFWIKFSENEVSVTNMKTVNFPILKYRIHSENYICNEVGKFNALNGEIRTLTKLMHFYDIPCFGIQRLIFQFLRMPFIRKFKLSPYFHPLYFKRECHNKVKILKKCISHTYPNGYNNIYLDSLILFYRQLNNNREIVIKNINSKDLFYGKDVRDFTNKLFNDKLPKIYYELFKEMEKGFNQIIVKDKKQKELMIIILKFLCLYPYVEVKVGE